MGNILYIPHNYPNIERVVYLADITILDLNEYFKKKKQRFNIGLILSVLGYYNKINDTMKKLTLRTREIESSDDCPKCQYLNKNAMTDITKFNKKSLCKKHGGIDRFNKFKEDSFIRLTYKNRTHLFFDKYFVTNMENDDNGLYLTFIGFLTDTKDLNYNVYPIPKNILNEWDTKGEDLTELFFNYTALSAKIGEASWIIDLSKDPITIERWK